ncbi:MAG: trimethylamine--corrinoid methyltransferase, partial [Gammaproteobacteria bacterium]|nr:trimethylamine--corrinoid methyltransferase [Gammaproteobacteria bacterium]
LDFETWSGQGSLTLQEKANQRVLEIISSHRTERLPREIIARLDDIVARK